MTSSANACGSRRVAPPNPRRRCSTVKPPKRPSRWPSGQLAWLLARPGYKQRRRGKKVFGRKRHMVVDTLGLVWTLCITPASVQDRDGARLALTVLRESVKFPKTIWADTAYRAIVSWAWIQWLWTIKIVSRPRGQFVLQKKRWIVGRTFGWLNRFRRLAGLVQRAVRPGVKQHVSRWQRTQMCY